jgi:hypothetical protein
MQELTLIYLRNRNMRPGTNKSFNPRMQMASSNGHATRNASQSESKLELFGFDSLVNILGLKRCNHLSYSFLISANWSLEHGCLLPNNMMFKTTARDK